MTPPTDSTSTPPTADPLEWREAVRAEALALGFEAVGFATADPLGEAERRRWDRWLASDRAGEMTYMTEARPRRTHPRDLLPEARSAIVVAAGYYDGDPPPREGEGPAGRVARYAWGEDYHNVLRRRLKTLAASIERGARERGLQEPALFRICVDSAQIDERALAVRSGLGFIGKNTLLLNPRHGSWVTLAVALTSVEFPPDEPAETGPPASCGSCRACLDVCPTGALTGPYELEPRRCIAYVTIEARKPTEPALAELAREWAFGCDLCQEVCPFNARPAALRMPELARDRGAGPWIAEADLDATPSGKAFERRWRATPLLRVGLKKMRRNLGLAPKPEVDGA